VSSTEARSRVPKSRARDVLIANHAEAIRQEAYTDDEALRLAFTETMTRAAEIAKERVGICQRLMEIAAICRESNRSVQIEAIAQTERRVRQLAEQPPTSAGGE
jgi:hypothetical protein